MSISDLITLGVGPGGSPSGMILMGITSYTATDPGGTFPMGRWDLTQWAWDYSGAPAWDSADSSDNNLFWAIEVDWDNDHAFDGSNESYYALDYKGGMGRQDYLRIEGEDDDREATGFYEFEPGTAQIILDNTSQRYSDRNTGSDLYPNVKKGRMARVRVKNGIDGSWVARFAGAIDDIQQEYDPMTGERRTTLYLVDHLKKLQRVDSNVGLNKTIKISEAIDAVLDDAGWPDYLGRNIEETSSTLSYFWTQGRRALTELRSLANGDLGNLFCNGAGVLTYYQRNHGGSVVTTLDESECLKEIQHSDVADSICNLVIVTALLRNVQATATIAQLSGDTPYIPAGESHEYFLKIESGGQGCPADNIVSPVATTDYTMNSAANGSGTDLTANFTVTYSDLGSTIKLVVTNNGVTDGYVTLLKVRGDPIAASTLILKAQDTASQLLHGVLRLRYSSDWLQSANEAEVVRDLLLALLKDTPGFFDVQLQALPEKQFLMGLMDTVSLTLGSFDVDAQRYKVGYYYDSWDGPTGQSVTTQLRLEPTVTVSGTYFIYDTSLWEVDTFYAP